MGEVYRATDTNLKRDVAVNVLPEALANDGDWLARFQREAEVLASLNHANIAQINGLEKADGAVKLLDFGIAKALENPATQSMPDSPVLTTLAMT